MQLGTHSANAAPQEVDAQAKIYLSYVNSIINAENSKSVSTVSQAITVAKQTLNQLNGVNATVSRSGTGIYRTSPSGIRHTFKGIDFNIGKSTFCFGLSSKPINNYFTTIQSNLTKGKCSYSTQIIALDLDLNGNKVCLHDEFYGWEAKDGKCENYFQHTSKQKQNVLESLSQKIPLLASDSIIQAQANESGVNDDFEYVRFIAQLAPKNALGELMNRMKNIDYTCSQALSPSGVEVRLTSSDGCDYFSNGDYAYTKFGSTLDVEKFMNTKDAVDDFVGLTAYVAPVYMNNKKISNLSYISIHIEPDFEDIYI